MLRIDNINKSFGEFALKNVSFNVNEGEYFVLLGPSGVGKTVLLETIAGLQVPDSGSIHLDDRDITDERIQARRLALVYQDRALFPHMTVRKNIAYGRRSRGVNDIPIKDHVDALAADVGITKYLARRPGSLSGGEAQRVALARALATKPRCLLLDEPLAALDTSARIQLRSLLRALNRQGHTMLHVTHDYEEAVSLASRVAIMENGRIAHTGTSADVFRHPKSEFIAKFIGIRNIFNGRLERPGGNSGVAQFHVSDIVFAVLTEEHAGEGCLLLRSEDITIAATRPDTSARNTFHGLVTDVVPARLGMEIIVDIGVEVSALVTAESVERLALARGRKVWVSFKASAARFIQS